MNFVPPQIGCIDSIRSFGGVACAKFGTNKNAMIKTAPKKTNGWNPPKFVVWVDVFCLSNGVGIFRFLSPFVCQGVYDINLVGKQ